ncbi:MAG: hypothetical protein U0703_25250 [Anaerolineae bacterium]
MSLPGHTVGHRAAPGDRRECGFHPLVAAAAVDDFAGQIRRHRQMTVDERSAVGEQCRKLVEQEFSLEKCFGRMITCLKN